MDKETRGGKRANAGRKAMNPLQKVIQVDCGYFNPEDILLIGGKPNARIIGRTAIHKKIKAAKKIV